jgi:hypothetical protein
MRHVRDEPADTHVSSQAIEPREFHPPAPGCGGLANSLASQVINAKGLTPRRISPCESLAEPACALGRAPVGERLWYDIALGTPLEPIIAECARRI